MNRTLQYLLTACVVFVIGCSGTEEPGAPAAAPPTLAITGVTLIGVSGGDSIQGAVILVAGSRIQQVGPSSEVPVPSDVELIEATGKFVIPGLADMHNHLAEGRFGFGEREQDYQQNLANLLDWGITSVYSTGIPDLEIYGDLKRISSDPASPYPHFHGVGKTFGAEGGHGSIGGFAPATPEEAREGVRENVAAGADGIKFVYSPVTYAVRSGLPQLDPEVMQAIIDEAHKNGLEAMVHAPILEFAKDVLRAGADGLVHGIIDEEIDPEFIELMQQNQAFYMTTHSIFEAAGDIAGWANRLREFDRSGRASILEIEASLNPELVSEWEARWDNFAYMDEQMPVLGANTKAAYDAGLLVVAGSDTGDSGAGVVNGLSLQVELQLLAESGLTPRQVLQTATINAARMVGREAELGTVEAGKLADLVILNADPLVDIGNVNDIHLVIKGGVVYDPAQTVDVRSGQSADEK